MTGSARYSGFHASATASGAAPALSEVPSTFRKSCMDVRMGVRPQ